ncbi:DUF6629 family protein [Gordonia sp. (in: high G+C Gram-positive bacteria)]|uniref:DUF6629 family protein n=1 Tax=Gordonia sp. (in: high G+C Gram-positive bacteria) TaxID=84139 RepID=UPI003C70CBAE
MCFSATASFVGAGVVAAGVVSLTLVRERRQVPFAALPFLFGIHQALEGWTWLALDGRESATLGGPGVHMWVMFAWAVLPAYIPWSVRLMETDARRRRRQLVPLAVGVVLSLYMITLAAAPTVSVTVVHGSLDYGLGVPFSAAWAAVPYVFATCLAPMLSSFTFVVVMGAGNLVAMSVAAMMNAAGYASIWCTFAAFLSLIVCAHLIADRRAVRTRSRLK